MTDLRTLEAKGYALIALRRTMLAHGMDSLDRAQRIEITHGSNALEGNTLTVGETALVVEKGLTIGGKPLRDHLEAIDHAEALDWVLDVAARGV